MYTEIFDSTLRAMAQGEGINFSAEDKLSIVKALDALGIAYIEAGNPGSNPKDLEFFEKPNDCGCVPQNWSHLTPPDAETPRLRTTITAVLC